MRSISRSLTLGGVMVVAGLPVLGCGPAGPGTAPATSAAPSAGAPSDRPPPSSTTVRPRPGGRAPTLVMDDDAPVAPDLERLATMFVSYAVGDTDDVPHRDSVSLSLGGRAVVAIDDVVVAPSRSGTWRICPADQEVYGASSCPVDLLGPIENAVVNQSTLVVSAEPGVVTCAPERTGPPPRGRLVVLRPLVADRGCTRDFALVLAADARGRLRAVDLTLAEP